MIAMDKILISKSLLLQNLSFKQIHINLNNLLLDPRLWEKFSSFHPNNWEKIKKLYLQRCSCQPLCHDFPKKEISRALH